VAKVGYVLQHAIYAKQFKNMIEINKIYQEPCLNTVARMDDNSIDCVITSPPYWQLRDYGYDGQWGLEPTYQEYLENLWSLMDAIYPKLKDGGTVWVNLGDTYARGARTKDGTNYTVIKTSKEHHIEPNSKPDYGGLDKCLLLIPHRFAIGCISPKWILRDDLTEEEKEYVIKEMINAKR
jgi:site-specific DNA-methyltransferase (adenine-specific)